MDKVDKKAVKQFQLKDLDSCQIYLQRIIVTAEKCFYKFRKYNDETLGILSRYEDKKLIPYDIYGDLCDKTSNVMCYLLNVIGDAQTSSISYFKYRKQAERLILRNVPGIALCPLTPEIEDLLSDFNKMRNWQNHIPESLLTSECALIKEGKFQQRSINPIEIFLYENVTYDYLKDLYDSNCSFYDVARKIIQMSKSDYACLLGEHIEIRKVYLSKAVDIDIMDASKMSSEIQGIKGAI